MSKGEARPRQTSNVSRAAIGSTPRPRRGCYGQGSTCDGRLRRWRAHDRRAKRVAQHHVGEAGIADVGDLHGVRNHVSDTGNAVDSLRQNGIQRWSTWYGRTDSESQGAAHQIRVCQSLRGRLCLLEQPTWTALRSGVEWGARRGLVTVARLEHRQCYDVTMAFLSCSMSIQPVTVPSELTNRDS